MFTPAFERAVSHVMNYEVGPFFNAADSDTQAGLVDTAAQRRKVGYTNDPNDNGGETKYGVAKSGSPTVDIADLDWAGAKLIYFNQYWKTGGCDLFTSARVAILHFDGCVNNGVGREGRFLQQVVGATQDGQVGPGTAARVNAMNEFDVCRLLADRREQYYRGIVSANPSQARYLDGWMRRINEMRDFVKGALS